jgi:hypothetical protein
MGEEKQNIDEILKRIDQLLNVLNMVSKNLTEVLTILKAVSVPVPTSREDTGVLQGVRVMFPNDLEGMLEFKENEQYIIIRPRRYLGSDFFAQIASIIRDAGGEYISAGKDSHFRIPKNIL